MKRKILIILAVVFIVIVFYWVATHGYVEVTVSGGGGGTYEASFTHSDDGKGDVISTDSGVIKKLVSSGGTDVAIRKDGGSYFASVKTTGFFRTVRVEATLAPESDRQFVGNDPRGCLSIASGVLVSWSCKGYVENAFVHSKATKTLPSINETLQGRGGTVLEGEFLKGGKLSFLTSFPSESESGGNLHAFYPIEPSAASLEIGRGRLFAELREDKAYSTIPYRDGTLVFSQDGSELFYMQSPTGKPQPITIDKAGTTSPLYSLSSYLDSILLIYGDSSKPQLDDGILPNSIGGGETDNEAAETGVTGADAFVVEKSGQRKFHLDFKFEQIRLCGENRLCAVHDNKLTVYDMAQDKTEKLYSIADVRQIEILGDKVLLVAKEGVVEFDTSERSGHFLYSFEGYNYCGLKTLSKHIVLCVDDNTGKPRSRSALIIDPTVNNKDSLDKKILSLVKAPEVATIAAYSRYIQISPNLNDVRLVPDANGGVRPDPRTVAVIINRINQLIDEVGLSRKDYMVYIPLQPR